MSAARSHVLGHQGTSATLAQNPHTLHLYKRRQDSHEGVPVGAGVQELHAQQAQAQEAVRSDSPALGDELLQPRLVHLQHSHSIQGHHAKLLHGMQTYPSLVHFAQPAVAQHFCKVLQCYMASMNVRSRNLFFLRGPHFVTQKTQWQQRQQQQQQHKPLLHTLLRAAGGPSAVLGFSACSLPIDMLHLHLHIFTMDVSGSSYYSKAE